MDKQQLINKTNEVIKSNNLEKRFIFVQNDKNSFVTVDGKSVNEVSVDVHQHIIWLGDSCIINCKSIGFKTENEILELYGGILNAWIQAVIS